MFVWWKVITSLYRKMDWKPTTEPANLANYRGVKRDPSSVPKRNSANVSGKETSSMQQQIDERIALQQAVAKLKAGVCIPGHLVHVTYNQ